ncbi:hypothetical protein BARBAKC583_0268 [Bartonella bacilliformis KC583]|uniref:Uncharacterized protein n=1 Tax=Bartonella bacilliformis (strain ATCC 35685 / KC583 / Herrer 020/F12,63) TaxID=360095 RepID=A1URJ1_BARBK|nr:hypothetical protein BARBAKC583_0268 [Bartonella bacilliformis KC583]
MFNALILLIFFKGEGIGFSNLPLQILSRLIFQSRMQSNN